LDSNKRFIEETFPVKEVSVQSAKEKNIRHGHISTMHIWWARRPLASSRTTNYAALIPASSSIDEWNKKRQFIIDFSKWENTLNQTMIKQAREDILKLNGGKPPKVLDPFAGGGAIPLEASRLGCETYSSDLNPVAVLIQKCTLEYPQRYGRRIEAKEDVGMFSTDSLKNTLLEDVRKWGGWILEEAKKEIREFYPSEKDGSIPVGYIWARTIPCQNPSCGAEIPLMRQYWLANKDKKKVALYPCTDNRNVEFRIVGDGYEDMPRDFDPKNGTVSRAVATCLKCGSVVDANTTRKLFHEGKAGERMVAIVLHTHNATGKTYRIADKSDMTAFRIADEYLKKKREKLLSEWGMNPVPDEPLPPKESHRAVGSQLPLYGFKTWGDLFNARQKLALITFAEKIRMAHGKMLELRYGEEYAKVVSSYLALTLDRMAMSYNTLTGWQSGYEKMGNMFARQALAMVWDYAEPNAVGGMVRSWESLFTDTLAVISATSQVISKSVPKITQASATSLPYPDDTFDAIFTDPPYYDNVPYAYLSDFFYVWLKRTVGHLYPELFSTPLTPKSNEIVVYANRPGGKEEANRFFEDNLKKSFMEIDRILKPNGIATIVYAHKSTQGWETLINSLLDSDLVITSAWPLNTERNTRVNTQGTASLASSIYIVARKMERQPTGFYYEVKEKLKQYLDQKLGRLWKEGIGGADFFIAAIGSAIEVFGKYEKVMDYEGNIVRADRLLDDVREVATDYAVHQILHDGFAGEITDITRFYVLWRWNYGEAKVPFDEARKLAQSCGIDLANEWNRQRSVRKEKEFIRVLGPQERQLDELRNSAELIDVLHGALLLWEKSNRSEMVKLLQRSGYGKGEIFYRVAQAISETLPIESKEKKLLDGFLAGRERLREEVRKEAEQRRLL